MKDAHQGVPPSGLPLGDWRGTDPALAEPSPPIFPEAAAGSLDSPAASGKPASPARPRARGAQADADLQIDDDPVGSSKKPESLLSRFLGVF